MLVWPRTIAAAFRCGSIQFGYTLSLRPKHYFWCINVGLAQNSCSSFFLCVHTVWIHFISSTKALFLVHKCWFGPEQLQQLLLVCPYSLDTLYLFDQSIISGA